MSKMKLDEAKRLPRACGGSTEKSNQNDGAWSRTLSVDTQHHIQQRLMSHATEPWTTVEEVYSQIQYEA